MDSIDSKLNILANQLCNIQKQLVAVQNQLVGIQGKTGIANRAVIVGVKDISSAQLFHAYKKGLNMEQLCQLADGKYTPEQIYRKLQKMGGV